MGTVNSSEILDFLANIRWLIFSFLVDRKDERSLVRELWHIRRSMRKAPSPCFSVIVFFNSNHDMLRARTFMRC